MQDFTQAELLMDLRIVSDPNGLFLCGDTAQTIARGVGFRFTGVPVRLPFHLCLRQLDCCPPPCLLQLLILPAAAHLAC